MRDQIIFHLVRKETWELQTEAPEYFSSDFDREKFIHTSTAAQLEATANRHYRNEEFVYLLHIDTDLLTSELKYEVAPSMQQEFPHIYGGINKDAIIKIETFSKPRDAEWHF